MAKTETSSGHYPSLYLSISAILLPVAGAFLVDREFFSSLFDDRTTNLLMDVVCSLLSLAAAGFLTARLSGSRAGYRFWTAMSLLVMGVLFGYQAIILGSTGASTLLSAGLLFGSLLAVMVWTPEWRMSARLASRLPFGLLLAATTLGVLLQVMAMRQIVLSAEYRRIINFLSGLLYVAASLKLARLYLKEGKPSFLWFAVVEAMFGAGAVSLYWGVYIDNVWVWNVFRMTACALLLCYLLTCTSGEFRKLEDISRRLSRSEARFRAITENTEDIVFVIGRNGRFIYVSPAAARIAGVTDAELVGRKPGSRTYPDDVHLVYDAISKAEARPGKSVHIGLLRVYHADGSILYLEGMVTCLYDNPDVEGIVLNYRNITDRVKSEQELKESRRRQATLISNLSGMVYRFLNDGLNTLEYVSEGSLALTGYPARAYTVDRTVTAADIIHRDDFMEMRRVIREACEAREPYSIQYRLLHADGSIKWVWEKGVGIEDENGEIAYVEGLIIDITDRVVAEQELRRTKFSIDNATDAIYWIARDGSLIDVNEIACRELGYTRDQLLRMNLHDISADLDPDRWDEVWENVKRVGSVIVEGVHVTSTGRQFPVEVSSNYMMFDDREYHCAFVRDISERKEAAAKIQRMNQELEQRVEARTRDLALAQEKLVTSEKMAALGNLVAGVAHEINTPLGIGLTATSHLGERLEHYFELYNEGRLTKSQFEEFLELIKESTSMILTNLKRAADLIQGFKQVSVDQSSERRRKFDLGGYLDEILISLKPKLKRLKHEVELECPEAVEIDSYPGALAQIVSNLVMNSVTHGFEDMEGGRIRIHVRAGAESVILRYMDDGKGMDRAQLEKIYDPFYTTKRGQGGSGLGMNVVYNLATRVLGGSIDCDSSPGGGVRFELEFPRVVYSDVDRMVSIAREQECGPHGS